MTYAFSNEQDFEDAPVRVLEKGYVWRNGILDDPSEQDLLDKWAKVPSEDSWD